VLAHSIVGIVVHTIRVRFGQSFAQLQIENSETQSARGCSIRCCLGQPQTVAAQVAANPVGLATYRSNALFKNRTGNSKSR
jgi:hypothetical protein